MGLPVTRSHPVVGSQRELEATSEAGAVDTHHDGLGEGSDVVEHRLSAANERLSLLLGLKGYELLDIGTGDEDVGLGRDHRQGAHVTIRAKGRERLLELALHGGRELVD